MGMESISEYIRPELLVLVAVLYFIGNGLKVSQDVPDRLIPVILGVVGVGLAMLWVISSTLPHTGQEWATACFTALVQGVLLAGQAVYVHQLGHQRGKEETPAPAPTT